ncbi:hypothetical protein SAMD00079811_16680 [Scytonema sp. HK-05]|nr:hypothetical protein SAMD00079811_16680 [Scytonema sp. HK-05]
MPIGRLCLPYLRCLVPSLASFPALPRSQPEAGNAYWEALPALLALLAASTVTSYQLSVISCSLFTVLRAFPGGTTAHEIKDRVLA